MDQLKRYLWPIATGGAVLIIALIAVSAYILPEGHKVSSANASKVTLLDQETSLQAQITGLEHESKQEPKDCSTLRQDLTLVPSTPTVDLFLHQISQLATNSGTATPSVTISSAGTPGAGPSAAGAATVGIDLAVSGTYRQVLNFLNGLDNVHSLQRLYAVSSVALTGNTTTGASSSVDYSLQLQGAIFYSTGQQDVCST
ncbi:MAG: type 4a pilus biogenesis protein PilO, partial [Acidimicrobiales bacterium]